MKETYLLYAPLTLAVLLVFMGFSNYYHHRYTIEDSSTLNKYKLAQDHILIRLKLFKYDNNFNYFLLVPYLIAWVLLFVALILYIIYWCGAVEMAFFFKNKVLLASLVVVLLLYMGYGGIIQQVILHSNRLDTPTFIMDKNDSSEQDENLGVNHVEI